MEKLAGRPRNFHLTLILTTFNSIKNPLPTPTRLFSRNHHSFCLVSGLSSLRFLLPGYRSTRTSVDLQPWSSETTDRPFNITAFEKKHTLRIRTVFCSLGTGRTKVSSALCRPSILTRIDKLTLTSPSPPPLPLSAPSLLFVHRPIVSIRHGY